MPIYEFYCVDCHTIFNFLSRTAKPRGRPACPRCGRRRMERRASAFAISKGRSEPSADDGLGDIDEQRMERVMAEMASEAEGMDDEDPRQMARMMRKLFDGTGMPLNSGMEEAIRRMEAGEDPDKIEEELGDVLDGDDVAPLEATHGAGGRIKAWRRRLRPPSVDETLYEM